MSDTQNGKKDSKREEFHSWRVFDKRKEARESAVVKGFLDNYGYLYIAGGFYRSFPMSWLMPLVIITNYLFNIPLLAYTSFLHLDDLDIVCENLHFCVLFITALFEIVNAHVNRSNIETLMRSLGRGVYDYGNLLDQDSIDEIQRNTAVAKSNKKRYPKIYMSVVGVAVIVLCLVRPITMFVIYPREEFENEENFDGLSRHSVLRCWYPFDIRKPVYFFIPIVTQYLISFSLVVSTFTTDIGFLCLGEEMALQLKIIGIAMRNVIKRASLHMSLTGEKNFKKSLSICLSQSVNHHVEAARLIAVLNSYCYYLFLVIMLGGAFQICLAGFVFNSNQANAETKFSFFFILSAEILHVLIFCWYGEQIKQLSSQIGDELYVSNWINHSSEMRMHLLMVQSKCLKKCTLSAGGFMDLSLESYSNVLSSAYSYFNLLNAVQ